MEPTVRTVLNRHSAPPRLVPELPFPPYSYLTGRHPHPTRDPAGHSFGLGSEPVPAAVSELWHESRDYRFGIDLFNHGYYWESHEIWEGLWHAAGRRGPTADFLKGLIKLAAAGVKAREGRWNGVRRHGERAAALFQETAAQLPGNTGRYFGLSLDALQQAAQSLAPFAADPPGPGGEGSSALDR
jgi:uncharacterized protein